MILALLAICVGAVITAQAGLNASLGKQLGNPLFGATVAFGVSLGFTALGVLTLTRRLPAPGQVSAVPLHLWFTGGLLGALAIGSVYWLIPRLGIGATLSLTLTGQLILALIAGHFGWFQLPVNPLSPQKVMGAATLILGIALIHRG